MVGPLLEVLNGRQWSSTLLTAFTALALLVPAGSLEAQGTVTGIVRAQGSMRPLSAAQVFIPGTGVGTLTSGAGRFLLPGVPEGERTVRVELVGYAAQEQTVNVVSGETVVVEFDVAESAIELDQIVVTGAGQATQRRMLGNTVATLNVESTVETAPIQNMSEVLQGREPGVMVTQSSGLAGEASDIRIRGSSSLSQSNQPIIYVDGVRIDSSTGFGGTGAASRLNDINPESIARIEVLKGAAAATLYGTEASNGVIQIFTKQGSAGDARWELNVEQGIARQDLGRYPLHAGFARTESEANRLAGFWNLGSLAPYEVFEADIFSRMFETGYSQAYALSVRGGSDFINYFVSGRYSHENGVYGATDLGPTRDIDEKKQASANITIFPTQNLRLRVNSMFIQSYHEIPSNGNDTNGGFSLALMSKPEIANENNLTGSAPFATVRETMYINRNENVDRFAGSVAANYTPIQDLAVDVTFGIDAVNRQGITSRPFGWNVDGRTSTNVTGQRIKNDQNRSEVTLDAKATYNRNFGDNFTANTVVGAQVIRSEALLLQGTGTNFPAAGLEVVGAAQDPALTETQTVSANVGAYIQEQIGYKNYLFVTGGLRFDRHSAFGADAGAALYPKVSVSFVPSDLPGWSSDMVSALRLRGAIGQSGLQPGAFDRFTTFAPLPATSGPGVQTDNLGNEDLQPEVSTEWEVGSEIGVFDNRAAFNVTYWNRTVSDALVNRQYAPSGGFLNSQLTNLGELKAWGVELGVNGQIVSGPRFSLSAFANGSFMEQTVTSMGGAPPIKVGSVRYGTWIAEGFAPGAFFGVALADTDLPFDTNADGQGDSRDELLQFFSSPRDPDAIRLLLAEASADGPDGEHYKGKPQPTWQGAVGFDVDFLSNFRVSSLFEYKVGNMVQDISSGFRSGHPSLGRNLRGAAEVESILRNPASSAEQRLAAAQDWANNYANFAPYERLNQFKKGDMIRWRELSLTYDVPGDFLTRMGADQLSFTFGARNLMLFTGYDGIDPENNVETGGNFVQGIDGWRPGTPRRFTFSARVGF